ncbi:MAG: hypothetical protein ACJ8E8_10445, partial [Sphingomicrobium sp.]
SREIDMPSPEDVSANNEKTQKYNEWKTKFDEVKGKVDIIVAKQRHGATGIVRAMFDSRITKFSDPVDEDYLPEMRS